MSPSYPSNAVAELVQTYPSTSISLVLIASSEAVITGTVVSTIVIVIECVSLTLPLESVAVYNTANVPIVSISTAVVFISKSYPLAWSPSVTATKVDQSGSLVPYSYSTVAPPSVATTGISFKNVNITYPVEPIPTGVVVIVLPTTP